MGVEYAHGIFVADLMWRPAWRHVEAVTAVLQHAGFRRETTLDSLDELPANLSIIHAGIQGPRVREIIGASRYAGIADQDRYIQDAVAVFGVDFKQPMTEEYGRDVIAPPGAVPDDEQSCGAKMQLVYPATWDTAFPKTRRPGLFWRSGIVIDCGKAVPAIADDDRRLPNRALLRQLEAAFETPLVELGWIY